MVSATYHSRILPPDRAFGLTKNLPCASGCGVIRAEKRSGTTNGGARRTAYTAMRERCFLTKGSQKLLLLRINFATPQ